MKNTVICLLLSVGVALHCGPSLPVDLDRIGEKGDRTQAEIEYQKGFELHTKSQSYAEAAKAYQAAYELDPSWWRPLYQLACVNALLGNTEFSLEYLKAAWKAEKSKELFSYMENDTDLNALRETAKFQNYLAALKGETPAQYGEFHEVIGKTLECTSEGIPYPAGETMTRFLSPDGTVSGKDWPSDMQGSTMTHYEFIGGTWEIHDGTLFVTESNKLTWTSIGPNQSEVGKVTTGTAEYSNVEDYKKLFSPASCDISSTF